MNRAAYTYPDGTKYEGEWKNGKRHGHGMWTKPNGLTYVGEWKDDKPNGQGTLTLPNGRKHKGEWKDGKRHGPGVEIQADGTKLYGKWEEGKLVEERMPANTYGKHTQEFTEARRIIKSDPVSGSQKRQPDLHPRREGNRFESTEAKHYRQKSTRKRSLVWPVLLIIALLGLGAIVFLLTGGEVTYTASGRVVDYAGEGISGATIDFGEEFGATSTDEKGYWFKNDLQGDVTVTPLYGHVVFYPIRSELSAANSEADFTLLKEMKEGVTSPSGEYTFSSNLTAEEEVEVTVVVEDVKTGEPLEGIEIEVVVSGDAIEILLQDNKGEYLPGIVVFELEHLDNYHGVEVRKGSLLVSVKTALLAVQYLEWAIENPREASAIVALGVATGLDAYGLASYTAGGIAIMTAPATGGVSALPGAGAIATGFATTVISEFLKVCAESVFADKEEVEHSVVIYIFESRESTQFTKIVVSAGATTDEIVEATESIVGSREFDIEFPEKNPAEAYYNDDGTPKFFYIYLKEPSPELVAEPEPEHLLEEFYVVNVKTGSNLFIRKTPGTKDKPDDDIIDRVPRGRLLKVIDKHDNNVVIDNFTWWEVKDPRTEITGWVASEYLNAATRARLDIETSLYDDPILQYLGWKEEDIIQKYGEPDERGITVGEFFSYSDKNFHFVFGDLESVELGAEKIVTGFSLLPGAEVMGVKVGMTFDEIEDVWGPSRSRGYCEMSQLYLMVYFFGEELEGPIGEIEFYFYATGDDAPTEISRVIWKIYERERRKNN